jgi:hypothetical protein
VVLIIESPLPANPALLCRARVPAPSWPEPSPL